MATVDSTSTDAEVKAAYDDNASYLEDRSVAKARAFVTAGRILLRRLFSKQSDEGASVESRVELIRAEIQDAAQFLRKYDDLSTLEGNLTTVGDMSGMRD